MQQVNANVCPTVSKIGGVIKMLLSIDFAVPYRLADSRGLAMPAAKAGR